MSLKNNFFITAAIGLALLSNAVSFGRADLGKPLYLDPDQPVEKRVEDLLGRMTLKGKVGQMNMTAASYIKDEFSPRGADLNSELNTCRRKAEGTYLEDIGPEGGLFSIANRLLRKGPRQQAEVFNELQKTAIEQTRLGIPLIQIEEGVHGLMASGATIFPEGPAIGSSWDMDLVRQVYCAAAREAKAIGVHQLCTLVIEPIRDPRLGRNQEAYSEDPYLCSCIAEAIVAGAQGRDVSANDKVVATLCHFPGQSQPVGGLEFGSMEISERILREVFLPPWVAGIAKAGALSVMATYPEIDGVPAHGSKKLLTEILRGELGFKGFVLAEGGAFNNCFIKKKIVATQKEAGRLAVDAGVDVGISREKGYLKPLIENVEEGNVSIETIDTAVRRILRVKFLLGLFENPYVESDSAIKVVHSRQHQELALQAAREGIALLKNQNNLLPLSKNIKSIAVIGPNAANERNQLGDYISNTILQKIVTVLDGIKNKVSPKTKVTYVKGCDVFKTDTNEISKACKAAKKADVAIIVVGENERKAENGTVGEGRDVASLDLTGLQEDLVKAVVKTGTPTVVVLINGRPLSIRWVAENVPAIVEAWNCGEQGGNAVADVLFGDYNPGGKLSVTFPRHVGQLPVYYNYKPPKRSYVDMSSKPLFEFGHGLSYTKFEYSNLKIKPKPPAERFGTETDVLITLDVENVGGCQGDEVVQLYIDDCLSSVVTPVEELKGFERIALNPGEKKTVQFTVTPYQLSLLDRNLKRMVEPGIFEVMVGSSSEDIRLRGSFEVED